MKPRYLIPILLLLFSCKNEKEQQLKRDIVGTWEFVKYDFSLVKENSDLWIPGLSAIPSDGITFQQNGTFLNETGFYAQDTTSSYENYSYHYYGKNSVYKIDNDSISFYNPVEREWWCKFKIVSLKNDTLSLRNKNSVIEKFTRRTPVVNPREQYDRIIVSFTGCFGTCPSEDISIARNGAVLFRSDSYAGRPGLFTSYITQAEYLSIQDDFKKAGINQLKNEYYANHSDDATVTVTFIKNGKMVKTVLDYGNKSPLLFRAAYNPLSCLYEKLKLKPLKRVFKNTPFRFVTFVKEDRHVTLEDSEAFFLFTALMQAQAADVKFEPLYQLHYLEGQSVQTDGRYYKFPPEAGGITLDVGYNFIERNNLEKRFVKNKDAFFW